MTKIIDGNEYEQIHTFYNKSDAIKAVKGHKDAGWKSFWRQVEIKGQTMYTVYRELLVK